jgi:hypothetical protein
MIPAASSKNISQMVDRIHAEFSEQVGSEQIAQKAGLLLLGELITERKFKNFLEVGSGIGTISKFLIELLNTKSVSLVCFEVDLWCQNKLCKNLGNSPFELATSIDQLLNHRKKMDLVIIDDFIDEDVTTNLLKNTRPEVVFIEGHRRMQRLFVLRSMYSLGMHPRFKNYSKSGDSYKLGCTISTTDFKGNYKRALCFIYFSLVYSKITEIRSRIPLRSILGVSRGFRGSKLR